VIRLSKKTRKNSDHDLRAPSWSSGETEVTVRVAEQSTRCLEAYRVDPLLVEEHAGIERATAQGGYGRRQIYELVQNGADALISQPGGKIHVLLTSDALYCANEGEPIDPDGVDAILSSHISMKRGTEIGRFGLGFKSVLGVTSTPHFFGRSGSFIFDEEESRERITHVVGPRERTPVLRLAVPIDATSAAKSDQALDHLMEWATTVVRLPRNRGDTWWLSDDLAAFPGEFLLFASHVGSLILDDRVRGRIREIRVSHSSKTVHLNEGAAHSRWRVFQTDHEPSAEARKDAGELAERHSVPIYWAAPLDGVKDRGKFWAFFPTEYDTTLSGIVNAPWKTNEDRQNLLTGPFNEELIDAAAKLVVTQLWHLSEDLDTGRYLDLMPARGREAAQWADDRIGSKIYELARLEESVPDQTGDLRLPGELRLHPRGLPDSAVQEWSHYEDRPTDWCHSSVNQRDRYPRAERLVGEANVATVREWLEALVADRTPRASAAALRVVHALYEDSRQPPSVEIAEADIILTTNGELRSIDSGSLFLPNLRYEGEGRVGDIVHPGVLADEKAFAVLSRLGVSQIDLEEELKDLLSHAFQPKDVRWGVFWDLVGETSPAVIKGMLAGREWDPHDVHARVIDGSWQPLASCLLPGPIVPGDGSRDLGATIDIDYHREHLVTLRELGALAAPVRSGGRTGEGWFRRYRKEMIDRFLEKCSGAPQRQLLDLRPQGFPGPLNPLTKLSDEGRVRFTRSLLDLAEDLKPWVAYHTTRPEVYDEQEVENPCIWMIRELGLLPTSLGPVECGDALSPAFSDYQEFFPVAQCRFELSQKLGLPDRPAELDTEVWEAAISRSLECTQPSNAARLYSFASAYIGPPVAMLCEVDSQVKCLSPGDILVTCSRLERARLVSDGRAFIEVESEGEVDSLVRHWGLMPASTAVMTQVVAIPAGDPTPLTDEFPGISFFIADQADDLLLARCAELRVESVTDSGKTSEDVEFLAEGNTIYWLNTSDDDQLLSRLAQHLGLPTAGPDYELLRAGVDERKRKLLLDNVRKQPDDVSRFMSMVDARSIARHLPSGLVESVHHQLDRELDHRGMSELAFAVYGVDVLREFRNDLELRGLQPPMSWSGSRRAREFVRQVGFSQTYAGFEAARRDPLLKVDGSPTLPELHGFQRELADRTRELVSGKGPRRGLMSLPTGAGKTRVGVQALVETIRDDDFPSPILWVAQTDELCEQAVSTWQEVWRALGPRRELLISRLWAQNEAEQFEDADHVVVATIAKLEVCLPKPNYRWLFPPYCLVIDEAHGATTPSYTALLRACGLGVNPKKDKCALLGLTATPFRGINAVETERLAGRFGRNRIDEGVLGEDVYLDLQKLGVLSRVHHKRIEGSEILLSEAELSGLKRTRLMPTSVGDRLARDMDRNASIINSIKGHPKDWTVLLFAGSVLHAQTLAALLSLDGVPAAAVSGDTEPRTRRHYVEEFRGGRIRVLTNYGVFTEGFDAPAVRAVYVARPTYSPNRYLQMIGRGLRGPLNGGKDECLIANVDDTVQQFGEELAFTQFEYLWNKE